MGRGRFEAAPDCVDTVVELAKPATVDVANLLTGPILGLVPTVDGVVRASYNPSVEATEDGARWHPGSPFWHWIEYGTATSMAYRPIQQGAASLGLRFEAS